MKIKQPPSPDNAESSTNSASGTRRRFLTGGVAAGAALPFLPHHWVKPVVEGVMLPAHAQTTCSGSFSQTEGYDIPFSDAGNLIPDQEFTYDLGGAEPCGDGSVTISNLAGDLGDGAIEQWTIWLGPVGSGVNLGTTNNSPGDCASAPGSNFPVTREQLQNAIDSGSIVINAVNGDDIQDFCDTNTMDVTLEFPTAA